MPNNRRFHYDIWCYNIILKKLWPQLFFAEHAKENIQLKKINQTPRKIRSGKSLIKRQSQMLKHGERMDKNCYIPDLLKASSDAENGGLNLV